MNQKPNKISSRTDLSFEEVSDLYKNVPESLIRLLRSRGHLDVEAWDGLFRPSLSNIKSPFKLDDMAIVVDRLMTAYQSGEGILVYGDFDLDGSSGAALLYCGLRDLGFKNLFVIQPKRLTDGYGVHAHILKQYVDKVKVVITVDVGITAIDATEYANANGIDMLITDHHLPKAELPKSMAIVNPNKGFCNSGLQHLCGAGVGFYVFLATWMKLKEELKANVGKYDEDQISWIKSIDPKNLLDLFVIGTVTDLVPLVDENRVLVKHGLKMLERTERPGLRALMQKLGLLGKKLGTQDIGFKLAPKLNSLSRMDKGLLPIDVFLCEDEDQAERMVEQILSLNSSRLSYQKKAEQLAAEMAFDIDDEALFIFDESFHKGVVGLVATRLAQSFFKPSFVGGIKEGVISGSARVPDGSELNLVEIMDECPSLKAYGGHAQAAGFELAEENAENFNKELAEYFVKNKDMLQDRSQRFNHKYDLELKLDELNATLLSWIQKLEPFGVGFEHPIFKLSGLEVIENRALSGGHLKFKVSQNKAHELDCIWFKHNLKPEELDTLMQKKIDLYGQLEFNEYLGQKKLQFIVHNFTTFS